MHKNIEHNDAQKNIYCSAQLYFFFNLLADAALSELKGYKMQVVTKNHFISWSSQRRVTEQFYAMKWILCLVGLIAVQCVLSEETAAAALPAAEETELADTEETVRERRNYGEIFWNFFFFLFISQINFSSHFFHRPWRIRTQRYFKKFTSKSGNTDFFFIYRSWRLWAQRYAKGDFIRRPPKYWRLFFHRTPWIRSWRSRISRIWPQGWVKCFKKKI